MSKPSSEDKRIVLIASADSDRVAWLSQMLPQHISNVVVFSATDGITAISKIQNAPPHVLIVDMDLPKLDGLRLIDQALSYKDAATCAFILSGTPPADEHHLDELVTGQVQYWTNVSDEAELTRCLMRALNFAFHETQAEYQLKFLARGDLLCKEGDRAESVFFVKKGQLQASRRQDGKNVVLGNIEFGEFVGEMAYINGEARNAYVIALTDCELIEVPIGHFESVLYKRPSWSKALMMTLSRRVKRANAVKTTPPVSD